MKATLESFKKFVETLNENLVEDEQNFFGIRADNCLYKVGDVANCSHQLYQDPDYDENGELIYPYIEGGKYMNFYDAGELDGTSCIEFDPKDNKSVESAYDLVLRYPADNLYVIFGENVHEGNDRREILITDAKVIAVFEN